ncbi:macro domain-containing protein [Zooshikella ganghwensis]|uniref:macro domain-containing protein n=1 Tax=Zooshikella ganghwensis TaxID=202772 RepID=UPI000484B22C|nr:macro domain-containing protein [Zooshikella ganghwensis]
MISFQRGDIFTAESDAIVNPVNCMGIMGKGLALEFKKRFPDNFEHYKIECQQGNLSPGITLFYESSTLGKKIFIINFPTKNHWREKSKLSYIDDGLTDLLRKLNDYSINTVTLPALGVGLGGLPWQQVKLLLVKKLAPSEIEFTVMEPK